MGDKIIIPSSAVRDEGTSYQFSGHKWEMRNLTDYGISHSDTYMTIALECSIASDTMGGVGASPTQ